MDKVSLIFISFFLLSCMKEKADLIIHHATVYTVDSLFTITHALALRNGKILATGSDEDILGKYDADKILDADGKFIYPGFIDAHCHFLNYGLSLRWIDLKDTRSIAEITERITNNISAGYRPWILGRGWDQNNLPGKNYPDKSFLDSLFPDIPVFLKRIDGHAALVNSAALTLASIEPSTSVEGGLVEVRNGKLTGILIDNAVDFVEDLIPPPSVDDKIRALKDAEQNCFSVGLITVDDAGLDRDDVLLIDSLQKSGELKIRIYAMLNPTAENFSEWIKLPPYLAERLSVRSFKFYCDGALGSRGALLLEPYADKPDHYGLPVTPFDTLLSNAERIAAAGFQMNTHCIGDSAVRMMLDIYSKALSGNKDKRWRIEHAQVVHQDDLQKFSLYGLSPSVQPTHATSDMDWAAERLGPERVKTAYAYRDLLKAAGIISSGSDFPVEQVNPLFGFYAAVSRKDIKGLPQGGFQPENSLTREEALKGMTIWAAYANFEETVKGSIEPGKYADFVLLDTDIMTVYENEIHKVKVLYTYVNGEVVYGNL